MKSRYERPLLEIIFYSHEERRLRSGWRLVLQSVLLLVLLFGLGFLLDWLVITFNWNSTGSIYLIINVAVEFLAICGSVILARHFLDRRSFASLGLALDLHVTPDIFVGVGIAFIMMGGIFFAMTSLGWIDFRGFAWQFDSPLSIVRQLAFYILIFTTGAFQEELLTRGYQLQTISSGLNLFWGVLISSAIFGMLHLANPNATWISAAGIFVAGLFLALPFIRTGQLWLSIGLHFGWNFFEGFVFGFPVSGFNDFHIFKIFVSGPGIWTGGAFGPEAGLIVLPALVVGSILVLWYTHSHSRVLKS
jgi:membrane protease YdiL (CAAX protease family)